MDIAWPVSLKEHKALRLTSIYCPAAMGCLCFHEQQQREAPTYGVVILLTVTVHYSAEGRDVPNAGSSLLVHSSSCP